MFVYQDFRAVRWLGAGFDTGIMVLQAHIAGNVGRFQGSPIHSTQCCGSGARGDDPGNGPDESCQFAATAVTTRVAGSKLRRADLQHGQFAAVQGVMIPCTRLEQFRQNACAERCDCTTRRDRPGSTSPNASMGPWIKPHTGSELTTAAGPTEGAA